MLDGYRHKGHELAPVSGHLDGVVVKARDDVGAAADQGLQRLGAAGEVFQLHGNALFLVEAELLRERGWEIDQLGLPADGDAHRSEAGRDAAAARHRGHAGHKGHGGDEQGEPFSGRYWHLLRRPRRSASSALCVLCYLCVLCAFHRSSQRSTRATAALTITTTIASTVMPAKTPVVSNVPSACEIT